jgi:hypothetical protein
MLIRTNPRGATLDDYLQRYLLDLLTLYLKMTTITETLRTHIAQNEQLTQLELVEFFQQRIRNPHSLLYFLQRCTQTGYDYDIEASDAVYLTYHIQSNNNFEDFTDIDIQELLCPLDLNPYHKHYATQHNTFYQNTIPNETKYRTQTANFLGKTYQKMYERPKPQPAASKREQLVDKYTVVNTNRPSSLQRR